LTGRIDIEELRFCQNQNGFLGDLQKRSVGSDCRQIAGNRGQLLYWIFSVVFAGDNWKRTFALSIRIARYFANFVVGPNMVSCCSNENPSA